MKLLEILSEGFKPEMQKAIDEVVAIFKKAGKKVSTRIAKNKLANLYAGPFAEYEAMDILYEAGFRLTKTGAHGVKVLRRGTQYCVINDVEKNAKLTPFEVSIIAADEAAEKDGADAKWNATYKGIKFKKWEG